MLQYLPPLFIILTIATIGDSQMSNDCRRLEPVEHYHEECSEGQYYLQACFPGYRKRAQCVGNNQYFDSCVPCETNHYLDFPNNCTSCVSCTICNATQYIYRECTHENDAICKTQPSTTVTSPEDIDAVPSTSTTHLPDRTSPTHEHDAGGTKAWNSSPLSYSTWRPVVLGAMVQLYFSLIH